MEIIICAYILKLRINVSGYICHLCIIAYGMARKTLKERVSRLEEMIGD